MKDIRNKLVTGGLFGLAVIIALLMYTDPGLKNIGAHLRGFPTLMILPVLGLTLFNYALRWVKWHYYLRVIGVEDITATDSAAIWVSGFVLALSPGKVAELLKAAVLRAVTGTPIAHSAPIIVAERVTDGLAMLVLAAVGLGGILVTSAQHSEIMLSYLPSYFLILGLLLAGIVLVQIRPLFLWLLRWAERLPGVGRLSRSLRHLYDSSYELFRPKVLVVSVFLGIVSWAGECVGFFLILQGLGLAPTWLLFWQAMFILAAASIIGGVSGLPGGLGAAELTIAGMMQTLVLGRQDPGLAGTATILVRLFTLWFAVTLGLITAVVFRHRLFPDRAEPILDAMHGAGPADEAANR